MFNLLKSNIHRRLAQFDWQFANCSDIYRLEHILNELSQDMNNFYSDAQKMVKELEDIDNG